MLLNEHSPLDWTYFDLDKVGMHPFDQAEYQKQWKRDNAERLNAERRARREAWAAAGRCRNCGHEKPLDFATCEKCRKQCRDAILKNNEHHKAKKRAAYWADPESARAAKRAWGVANKELKARLDREYRAANPEACSARKAAWYAEHRAAVSIAAAETRAIRESSGLCTECGAGRDRDGKMCSACLKRQNEHGKKWRASLSKEERSAMYRRHSLRRLYGLSPQQWDAMLVAQDNKCAICRTDSPGKKGWQTDHDHEIERTTGKIVVRKILCGQCNLTLGCVNDNQDRLRAMINYLEAHKIGLVNVA